MKSLLITCFTLLISVNLIAAEAQESEVDYFAVFMGGKKVGYSVRSRVVSEKKVITTEQVNITISRGSIPVSMEVIEKCIETPEGKPLGFEVVQDLSIMTMKMVGTVNENGMVDLTTTSMGGEQSQTFEWPQGALLAEGLRLLEHSKGLKEGLKYKAKVFSPSMGQAVETQISIGPKKDVDLLGRVVNLTEVKTKLSIPGAGDTVSTSYVDDDHRLQKDTTPVAGIQMELVACTKEFALSENEVFEVIDQLFISSPVPLENLGSIGSITYQLSTTKQEAKLQIPSGDNQSVRVDGDMIIVTVDPVAIPEKARFPYKGSDETILESLKPNRFLQSDNKDVMDLAARAIGNTKDAGRAAKMIESFVADYVQVRSLSVGYASAAEVAASRQGDCSEFSVLTTAMCRAVGIPARMVVGVAYVKDFAGLQGFGPHAWTQAYIGDKWIGLDSAFKSAGLGGYGPGHIALAVGNGEPADFFNLVSTLGQFEIDKLTVHKSK